MLLAGSDNSMLMLRTGDLKYLAMHQFKEETDGRVFVEQSNGKYY